MSSGEKFLRKLYEGFNKREIETVLSALDPDVHWANGMEGGFVEGREAVREYWERQFPVIKSQVEPLAVAADADGRQIVTVHQTVRNLEGNLLNESEVKHIFTIHNGLVTSFEIES